MKIKQKFFHLFSLLTILSGTLLQPGMAIATTISTDTSTAETEIVSDTSKDTGDAAYETTDDSLSSEEQSSNETKESQESSDMPTETSSSDEQQAIAGSYVSIDKNNFPDDAFRTYVGSLANEDEQLSTTELAAITELDLSDLAIQSLKGIEFFTALTTLDVSDNNLETLELQDLKDLQDLDISGNHLVELDLSHNVELDRLETGIQTHELEAAFEDERYVVSLEDLFSDQVPEITLLTEDWTLDQEIGQLETTAISALQLATAITLPDLSSLTDEERAGIDERLVLDIDVTARERTVNARAAKISASTINYQSFVEGQGWQGVMADGGLSGTTGQSRKILGFRILSEGLSDASSITYRGHFQSTGWGAWTNTDATIGDTSSTRQMESLQVRSTGQDVYYRVHVRGFGWLGWAKNGEIAGTTGLGARIEAIEISFVAPIDMGGQSVIEAGTINSSYRTFSSAGWSNPVGNGVTSGTTGQSRSVQKFMMNSISTNFNGSVEYSGLVTNAGWTSYVGEGQEIGQTGNNLEGIRIRLTGELANQATVYYRVHVAGLGWLNWTKNGGNAGSTGYNLAIEAIQVIIKPKYLSDPTGAGLSYVSATTLGRATLNVSTHVQRQGWVSATGNNIQGGTTGQGLRVEGVRMSIANAEVSGGITYNSHVQGIGWQGYRSNGDLSGTTGQSRRLEGFQVKLTGAMARVYDVYYRAHIQTYGWLDWAANGQSAGSSSLGRRAESIQVYLVPKGSAAPGSTERPFMRYREFLFVMGHGAGDPGAIGSGTNEAAFTRNELLPYLRKYAAQLKTSKIHIYDTSKNMFQDTQKLQGAHLVSTNIESVTEFHLDAASSTSATGGHVIVHRELVPTAASLQVAQTIRQHVGWWGSVANTNGLSLRADLLNMNVFRNRGIDYRLAELGFITNPNDVARIRANIDTIAKQIVQDVTGEKL